MSEDTLEDRRDPGFFIIDDEIIDEYGAQLGPLGVAVYNVLVKHSNKHGKSSFPSYQTIADKLGISRNTAIKGVEILVEHRVVGKRPRTSEKGAPTSNAYRILPVKKRRQEVVQNLNHPPERGGADSALGSANDALPLVQNLHHGGADSAPEPDSFNQTPLNQNTHTQATATGQRVCVPDGTTAYSTDQWREYAAAHPVSVREPEKFVWSKRVREGKLDDAIREWYAKGKPVEGSSATAKPADTSACPDCGGRGHYFTTPTDPKTYQRCTHPRLAEGLEELHREYDDAKAELAGASRS